MKLETLYKKTKHARANNLANSEDDMIKKCIARFKEAFPQCYVPPIAWNRAMKSSAGRVISYRGEDFLIELNPHLVNTQERMEFVLMHELGHVADHQAYGEHGHGPTWKLCMMKMGADYKRTHNFDTSAVKAKRKKVRAQCDCAEHRITPYRAKQIKNKVTRLTCRSCRTALRLMEAA